MSEETGFERVLAALTRTIKEMAELIALSAIFDAAATATKNAFLTMASLGTTLALACYGALISIQIMDHFRSKLSGPYAKGVSIAIGLAWSLILGRFTNSAVTALLATHVS